jgi:hypothetical protein
MIQHVLKIHVQMINMLWKLYDTACSKNTYSDDKHAVKAVW